MTTSLPSRESGELAAETSRRETRISYAQTNLRLYAQLLEARYSAADIDRVRAAYELSLHLFTGLYRGSGKPFLAHLVGTASVLASLRARAPVVAAGLLHAAYTQGEFGNGWGGVADEKRRRLREAVGPEAEELVRQYTLLAWNERTIPKIQHDVETLGSGAREVLLIRLANELEDHLDLGVLYCADAGRRREYARAMLDPSVDMAKRLGFPELADALGRVFTETLSADVPTGLRRRESSSFVVAPASYWLRWPVRLRRLLARLGRR